jgi:putative hydrolase of the HAD superfamily
MNSSEAIESGITTVIFDFGMVISSFEVAQFLRNLVPITGKSVEELKQVLAVVREFVVDYETGLVTTDEFVAKVLSATRLPISGEEFRLAYNNIFTPIPFTSELIRRLKPRYRLGLLSNTSEWHFQHAIKTVEVFPLFDAVTLSFEVKAMKPAEAIYRDMLSKLGATPQECVYIDDLPENIESAARLGMHAIRYVSPDQIVADLQKAGLVF